MLHREPPAGRQCHGAGANVFAGEPPCWRRALIPVGTITAPSSTRQSSCMNTVSAPAGIGAPVKMRIAAPALSAVLAV